MRKAFFIFSFLLSAFSCHAQTFGQLMLWDSHQRHPQIWSIEFDGSDSLLATYDAIYGHGTMIENTDYALRVYMSQWPRIDLYGKRLKTPELPVTQFYTTAEQRQQGYGADVLIVGDRMGVGSLLGWDGERPVDTNPADRRGQRLLQAGPDTASMEAYVTGWHYRGQCIDLTQRLTMTADSPWTQVEIITTASDTTHFLTGIQHLHTDSQHQISPDGLSAHTRGGEQPEAGVNADVELFIEMEPQYLSQTIDQQESVWMVVHPVDGRIRYRVRAKASIY